MYLEKVRKRRERSILQYFDPIKVRKSKEDSMKVKL
jgi:hypothetical protein